MTSMAEPARYTSSRDVVQVPVNGAVTIGDALVPRHRGTGLTGGMLHRRWEACREACNEGNAAQVIRNLIARLDRAIPRG